MMLLTHPVRKRRTTVIRPSIIPRQKLHRLLLLLPTTTTTTTTWKEQPNHRYFNCHRKAREWIIFEHPRGYYSKLYQKYEKDASSYDDNNKGKQKQQIAIYTNSSFPSYLGSVIPSSNYEHGTSWEIHPPFCDG